MTPFTQAQFREVAGRFPSGVTVVTGLDGVEPVGLTCQSFHALSLEPPMVVFAAAHTSTSWPRIAPTRRCCVNVLASDQEQVARTFATSGADKFADVEWSPDVDGCPIVEGAVAWFSCEIAAVHPGGDHDVVIADVRSLGARDGTPLVFHRGRYEALRAIEST